MQRILNFILKSQGRKNEFSVEICDIRLKNVGMAWHGTITVLK